MGYRGKRYEAGKHNPGGRPLGRHIANWLKRLCYRPPAWRPLPGKGDLEFLAQFEDGLLAFSDQLPLLGHGSDQNGHGDG